MSHTKVQRYTYDREFNCIEEDATGQYVSYDDYQKLEQQNAELVEALKYAKNSIETLVVIAYGKDAKPQETMSVSIIETALAKTKEVA